MLKVGLTGGIGCGKTTVSNLFTNLSVPVIDADDIAHKLVATGQPALAQIIQTFGETVIHSDGSLNRARLRELVFTDPKQKQRLENIIHPLVYQSIQKELEKLNAAYCIICIPLLFETQQTNRVDRILVIDCPVEIQIERVQKRDKLTVERIQSIIDTQVSRAVRNAKADDVIDNSKNNNTHLAVQIEKLHLLYLSLSNQEKPVCEHHHNL